MSLRKIRVLLADDHPIVLEGVRAQLESHERIEIVAVATDGRSAVDRALETNPDVIVIDLSMPGMSGLEAMRVLRVDLPLVKVIVLSMHDDKEYIREVIRLGGRGYLLKDAPPAELIRAVERVDQGKVYFSSCVSEALIDDYVEQAGKVRDRTAELSHREREVLALIADGCSNKEIAKQLCVSVRTVETHRERIMKKLGIHSVAGLTKYAISEGISSIE